MSTYELIDKNRKEYFVQHLPRSGDFDYNHCESYQDALKEIMGEFDWDEEDPEFNSKEEAAASCLFTYTAEEVLKAAYENYGWPIKLGFVEVLEDDTFF